MKSFKSKQNKVMNSIIAQTTVMLFLMAFTASSAWALDYTAKGQTIITFSQRITISGTVSLNLGSNPLESRQVLTAWSGSLIKN